MTGHERGTPLLAKHKELGARLTEFGGWDMPLHYSGVIAEHNAVRTSTGIFDVSHLGKLRLVGDGAGPALQRALTLDATALEPGRAKYALVLAEDGGCIDDVFCYRISDEEWLVVPNAANNAAVTDAIEVAGGSPLDEWDSWAILAVQGPTSFEIYKRVFPSSGAFDLTLHGWCAQDVGGREGMVARTGYTGEKGFELYAPAATVTWAFEALVEAGAVPVGLGARDTLRLEMGYALYGHELDRATNPLEAGLGWALAWETPFCGREALEAIRARGPARKLFGIVGTGRGVPRQGYEVRRSGASGEATGVVVSGNFSPTLGTGIALAFGASEDVPGVGEAVEVAARSRTIEGTVAKPPFIGESR